MYDTASSIGVKSSLWTFSIRATSALSLSSSDVTIAGTLVFSANRQALYLLSPAMITYLSPIGLTTIGSITPYFLIDSLNSFKESSLNFIRGWNLFGKMSFTSRRIIFLSSSGWS